MGTITLDEQAAPGTPSSGQVVMYAKTDNLLYFKDPSGTETAIGSVLQLMSISGLVQSNNSGDATNDIDISAGSARDNTNTVNMILSSSITKRLDASWTVGTNQGGLDTGAIGNNDYYIWLIKRSDTGVVDALFSLSSTAPTMPASYDYKRLIGWIKRVSATIVAFHAYETNGGGLEIAWDTPTLDINLANTLTTSRRTDAVKVPLGFTTVANLNVVSFDASSPQSTIVQCPDQTDTAPSASVAPLATIRTTTTLDSVFNIKVRTSAAGLIAARSNLATVDSYFVVTMSFVWDRRN